jgi:ATP-dependent Clp protease adaptor protein ClpS
MARIVCETDKPSPNQPSNDAAQDGHAGTATATRPAPSKPRLDKLPPYRVLLHNDDVNDITFVVTTLVELTPLNRDRAVEVMLEAHKTGVALVLVTHRERAELYQDQFQSKKLVVTIEPTE